jgi:hypothetical protein
MSATLIVLAFIIFAGWLIATDHEEYLFWVVIIGIWILPSSSDKKEEPPKPKTVQVEKQKEPPKAEVVTAQDIPKPVAHAEAERAKKEQEAWESNGNANKWESKGGW